MVNEELARPTRLTRNVYTISIIIAANFPLIYCVLIKML